MSLKRASCTGGSDNGVELGEVMDDISFYLLSFCVICFRICLFSYSDCISISCVVWQADGRIGWEDVGL